MSAILKSSADRFGDDLLELILSFLAIEDKFRFECLSKQVRSVMSVIYRRQSSLKLFFSDDKRSIGWLIAREVQSVHHYYLLDYRHFETVLTKLKYLQSIEFSEHLVVNSEIFYLIGTHCRHLKNIEVSRIYISPAISDITVDSLVYFGKKCGHSLRSLKFRNFFATDSEKLALLLSLTTEVEELEVDSVDWYRSIFRQPLAGNSPGLLPKLKEVKCQFHDVDDIQHFQDTYHDQLTNVAMGIRAYSSFIKPEALHEALVGFGRFRHMESLKLWLDFGFEYDGTDEAIVCKGLRQLAAQCPQLKRFALHLYDTAFEGQNCLAIAGTLQNLISLDITMGIIGGNVGTIKDLKHLSRLKHLNLDLNYLTDSDFESIGQYLPALVSVDIKHANVITDQTLKHLSSLSRLKSLSIWWNSTADEPSISSSGVDQLIDKCVHLCRLNLYNINGVDISVDNVIKFKTRAKDNANVLYLLKAKFKSNGAELDQLLAPVHPLPDNFKLQIVFP